MRSNVEVCQLLKNKVQEGRAGSTLVIKKRVTTGHAKQWEVQWVWLILLRVHRGRLLTLLTQLMRSLFDTRTNEGARLLDALARHSVRHHM
jgi:hypothetical protein